MEKFGRGPVSNITTFSITPRVYPADRKPDIPETYGLARAETPWIRGHSLSLIITGQRCPSWDLKAGGGDNIPMNQPTQCPTMGRRTNFIFTKENSS